MTDTLVSKLVALQRERGWTDAEMAERLCLSRQKWNLLRNGEQDPGVKALRAIAAAFPEFADDVRFFVAPSATKVERATLAGTEKGAAPTEEPAVALTA